MIFPCWTPPYNYLNTMRPRQNGHNFPDDIFKCMNLNIWISIKISLKFVPKGPINDIPALVQIMAWCRPGDKPLSEPLLVSLLTHRGVTRPQWFKMKLHRCKRLWQHAAGVNMAKFPGEVNDLKGRKTLCTVGGRWSLHGGDFIC